MKKNRAKKLVRVLKRKWFKPALYTVLTSFMIYMCISSVIIQKRSIDRNVPRFLITRLSSTFEEPEFMHLLLTIQEISALPKASAELKEFANKPYPARCPKLLEHHLNRMNWAPLAFQTRVKKLFELHDIYDRITRLDETIAFLSGEVEERRLPTQILEQLDLLRREKDSIIGTEISEEEYNFVKEYAGLIQSLRNIE